MAKTGKSIVTNFIPGVEGNWTLAEKPAESFRGTLSSPNGDAIALVFDGPKPIVFPKIGEFFGELTFSGIGDDGTHYLLTGGVLCGTEPIRYECEMLISGNTILHNFDQKVVKKCALFFPSFNRSIGIGTVPKEKIPNLPIQYQSSYLKKKLSFDVLLSSIEVTPDAPQSLQWLKIFHNSFANLISLLNGFPSAATKVQFEDTRGEQFEFYVRFNRSAIRLKANFVDFLVPLHPLLIKQELETVLNRWFNLESELIDLIELFCGINSAPFMHTQTEFLLYCQILESFHRAQFVSEKYMDPKKYSDHIKAIWKHLPRELLIHKTKLSQSLCFGYEYSAKERLKSLFDKLPLMVQNHIAKDKKGFAKKVLATRNYFTHYNPKLRSEKLSTMEMAITNYALRNFLQWHFLSSLGISEDVVVGGLEKTNEWREYNFAGKNLCWNTEDCEKLD